MKYRFTESYCFQAASLNFHKLKIYASLWISSTANIIISPIYFYKA